MPGDPDEPREDPTLSTVFPIQPEMDRILLAEEIKREGVRDSVIVWKGKQK